MGKNKKGTLSLMGTRRFGTFLLKGFVLVQDLTVVSFWYRQKGRGVILVHAKEQGGRFGTLIGAGGGGGCGSINGVIHCSQTRIS